MSKTNACRILDSLGIHYELHDYEVDPDDLSAENVASKVGLPPEQVFKTLAVKGDRNGVSVAVIPGNYELDFKALAHLTGDRNVEMLPLKEVQKATGVKGPALFHPIRILLTGVQSGPEFDKLVPLMEEAAQLALPHPIPSVKQRVAAFLQARNASV